MSIKWITLLFFWGIFSFHTYGSNTAWNDGALVLTSGEILWGEINCSFEKDVVQLKSEEGIRAFSAFSVKSFTIYDEATKINRYFRTIEEDEGNYKRKSIYEVVVDGEVALLRKNMVNYKWVNKRVEYTESDYKYYSYKDGEVKVFNNLNKKTLRYLFSDFHAQIKDFMEKEGLSPYLLKDQFMVFKHYNFLKAKSKAEKVKNGYIKEG